MIAEAQKIHPDMKVRLTMDESGWEMYMPTPYTEHYELDERFKGTAAWEMYEERDSGYDNSLERYRYKNGYRGVPLAGVAEYINLRSDQQAWAAPVAERLHAENDSFIGDDDWGAELSNERFEAYQRTQEQVGKLMEAEFKDKWEALRKKWDF
jgi:hypothetical protein